MENQSILELFPPPSLLEHLRRAAVFAVGERWPILSSWYLKRKCRVCGKCEDILFHFTTLVTVWNEVGQAMQYECTDHGGLSGKVLADCITGMYVYIRPSKPWWWAAARNYYQTTVLGVCMAARFVGYLAWDLYQWQIYYRVVCKWRNK